MTVKNAYATIAALCTLALGNAAYLTFRAFELKNGGGFDSFCDINSSVSCTNVLSHPLSMVFGIPFPAIALVVYPILIAIAFAGFFKGEAKFFKPLAILSAGGIAFNSFIIYREVVYIHAYCILCLMCTAIIVTVFGISAWQLKRTHGVKKTAGAKKKR